MMPDEEESLKQELDELVTQLDVELSPRRAQQMRDRVAEIRKLLNPPKSRVRLNILRD